MTSLSSGAVFSSRKAYDQKCFLIFMNQNQLNHARLTLYWPSIDQDIRDMIDNCQHCQDRLPSNPQEPIQSKPRPTRPFQHVAADFAQHGGCQFLITVDCFTDWPDVFVMGDDTSARALIEKARTLFCRSAAPDVFWSDQGPQFMADKFQTFLKDWGVIHKTLSPLYPQSNGKAEATVKSMKKIIAAAWKGRSLNLDKLHRSLMQYRNTPCPQDGRSPHRSSTDTRFKIPCQRTDDLLLQNGKRPPQRER